MILRPTTYGALRKGDALVPTDPGHVGASFYLVLAVEDDAAAGSQYVRIRWLQPNGTGSSHSYPSDRELPPGWLRISPKGDE